MSTTCQWNKGKKKKERKSRTSFIPQATIDFNFPNTKFAKVHQEGGSITLWPPRVLCHTLYMPISGWLHISPSGRTDSPQARGSPVWQGRKVGKQPCPPQRTGNNQGTPLAITSARMAERKTSCKELSAYGLPKSNSESVYKFLFQQDKFS